MNFFKFFLAVFLGLIAASIAASIENKNPDDGLVREKRSVGVDKSTKKEVEIHDKYGGSIKVTRSRTYNDGGGLALLPALIESRTLNRNRHLYQLHNPHHNPDTQVQAAASAGAGFGTGFGTEDFASSSSSASAVSGGLAGAEVSSGSVSSSGTSDAGAESGSIAIAAASATSGSVSAGSISEANVGSTIGSQVSIGSSSVIGVVRPVTVVVHHPVVKTPVQVSPCGQATVIQGNPCGQATIVQTSPCGQPCGHASPCGQPCRESHLAEHRRRHLALKELHHYKHAMRARRIALRKAIKRQYYRSLHRAPTCRCPSACCAK